MEIVPPHVHISLLDWLRAGIFPINTVGLPGDHGAVRTGTQGIGVKTPIAAAVAEATVGFAIELHMPNGSTFTIGILSIIVARGMELTVLFFGSTFKVEGAAPKLQQINAPPHTQNPILFPPYSAAD